jgi:hypothetical protein
MYYARLFRRHSIEMRCLSLAQFSPTSHLSAFFFHFKAFSGLYLFHSTLCMTPERGRIIISRFFFRFLLPQGISIRSNGTNAPQIYQLLLLLFFFFFTLPIKSNLRCTYDKFIHCRLLHCITRLYTATLKLNPN